jgi:lysophospholipase
MLLVMPAGDSVTLTPVAERFAARLKAGRALVIPGAEHELLMERDDVRSLFWAAFDAFVPGTPPETAAPESQSLSDGQPDEQAEAAAT